jgi:DNA mismatch repair protein MutL
MPRIQQLSPSVITKIAAGEVIDRPASVVKELLENAVDAGAHRIDVEIEQGGAELIRVVDDGCGILADDLPLALASHATSKIGNADDLFRIHTLGFRGEALASIAGVAQLTLQSRPADQEAGAEITSMGGELSTVRPWNGAAGTRIELRHLFYNTPVRRKFLRTPSTEMGHICEVVTRLALANPELHLTLRHNDKHVYEVPASALLPDRLGLFFGTEIRDQLYPLQARHGPIEIRGFIANPACERGTAKLQYFFVNRRWIRDRSLGHALQEAYRGLLMSGRYAVAFLFLDIPPDQVDVNVHPTKVEVRFRDAQAVYHLVFGTIRDRLRAENLTSRLQVPAPGRGQWPAPAAAAPHTFTDRPEPLWNRSDVLPYPTQHVRVQEPNAVGRDSPQPIVRGQQDVIKGPESPDWQRQHARHGQPITGREPDNGIQPSIEAALEAGSAQSGSAGTLKAIQLYDSYLVVETEDGMLVIDQHALHERILFEQLKARIRSGNLEIQRLLIPEPVEFPPDQAARALEHRQAMAELGLGVEEFGGGTLLVTSYPAILGNRSAQGILRAVVDHLVAKERIPNREQLLNDLLSLMACHAAVKAGDRLTPEEIASLAAERNLAHDTHHCPHGRPTALLFTRQELDRQFRRT